MRLITLAVGGAIGYVLGTKAGHGRYEQIVSLAKRMGRGERPTTSDWGSSTYASSTGATASSMGGDTFDSPLNT
jgi:hypothetical protein